jgi:tetratricopeptide (TPR) repeat protein
MAGHFSRSILLAATLIGSTPALAHEPGDRQGADAAGAVHFAVSCSPAAQQQFDHAVALLHSFWYEEAAKAFGEVAATDRSCAMAEWGIAMSQWYPLWYPPGERALWAGSTAAAKALALDAKTDRERAYIAAIGAFYKDWDKRDHRTRSLAYEQAMEQLHQRFPEDHEAAVFYALALDATALPTDKTFANQRKAAAILEQVSAEEPDHPGVVHYLIHSYDSAPLAEQGLPAARRYARIAPAVPHALHMPSHIFTRLGLWQESIDANRASHDVARAYSQDTFGPGAWDQETLHTSDYLEYAYLQRGQDREAKRIVEELASYRNGPPVTLVAAYAITAITARFALERRQWAEAATLAPTSIDIRQFAFASAITGFTRALGAAHRGDADAAAAEIAKLAATRDSLAEAKNTYWANQVEVQRLAAAAALAHMRGQDAEALDIMRSAVALETSMDKHPVTPGAVVPARELLADLLLELGQPAEALREYQATLVTDPNRFRSLFGAAQAAERAGDAEKAKNYYERLTTLTAKADTRRAEMEVAQAFLAKPR